MRNAKVVGITTLLVVLFVVLSILVPESFLTANNLENLLRRTALNGILGIGVAYVIITSGIDLSIGSIVCLAGCLFALFLRVDYRPVDEAVVLEVRAASSTLVVDAPVDAYQVGDRVRYYGGLRAETAIRQVQRVDREQVTIGQVTKEATLLTVDQAFSRDDSTGFVAKAYGVSASAGSSASQPKVDIQFDDELKARDRLQVVDGKSGAVVKNLAIAAASINAGTTTLEIADDLGRSADAQWWSVPLRRHQRMPILLAVGLVLLTGLALGLIHGLLITKVHLQPFVVTLCGLLIYRSISRWLVNDQPTGFGDEFDFTLMPLAKAKVLVPWIGGQDLIGIPVPFFILILVAILASIFLGLTIWGRYLLALGRSKQAADYSGINTDRITILAYIICATLAALGGMLFALDSNSVSPSSFGNSFELYAIAAAVLGGCSLRGGEGGILGVVIGSAVMQVLNNLILLLHISDTLQSAIIGAVILIGVMVDELLRGWARRRRLS